MKATHRIKLKSAVEMIENHGNNSINPKYVLFLINHQNTVIEVRKVDGYYENGGYGFMEGSFTNLREIKPEIEIPETPFYVQLSKGCHDVPKSDTNIHFINSYKWEGCERMYNFGTTVCPSFNCSQVAEKLNNGTWTICDAPEKVMVPWSDEDWKEWFLNDGIIDFGTSLQRASKITVDDSESFIYLHKWFKKDYIIKNATDRHGNKFEKEA